MAAIDTSPDDETSDTGNIEQPVEYSGTAAREVDEAYESDS